MAESGQVVALAGDILRRKALNHILGQASPVDADGQPVDLTPPGYDDEDLEDEIEDQDADDVEAEAAAAKASANIAAGSDDEVASTDTSTAEDEVSADE